MRMTTGSDDNSIIVCEHVSVGYDEEDVLRDVCLSIPRGAFLPFVGPNGAGKTTLLRAILGLLKPRAGRIITPFHRAPPGYVPQQKTIDPLYPVSVRRIAAMGLYRKLGWWRRPGKQENTTLDGILARLNLADHGDQVFAELSGGQRQKVLLARALASGAEVLVMDEPTSELDEASEKDVLAHLHRLSREEGKTVLLVHHGLGHLASLADVLCVVDHGRVSILENGGRQARQEPCASKEKDHDR